jgi:iron(III) transport system substrate-binding protein
MLMLTPYRMSIVLLAAILLLTACTPANTPAVSASDPGSLVIYSGRSESLVGPVIKQFSDATGIKVEARYGSTAEMAATLIEEGGNSPADVFFAQDPGGLGAVSEAGLLAELPAEVLVQVEPRFRSQQDRWVGVSGRARVVVYNTNTLTPADLPDDLRDFTDPQWSGRIGWAPTNGSFQAMVTAMRQVWGEAETQAWLTGIQANDPIAYENNTAIVAAVGAGEVEVGFVNHYYLYRFLQEEGEAFSARNYFIPDGGPGSLVMVAGVGRLENGKNEENAIKFMNFLLSPVAQQYFASQTFEYPLVEGIQVQRELTPLEELNPVEISLENLADLQGTLELLQQTGVLP